MYARCSSFTAPTIGITTCICVNRPCLFCAQVYSTGEFFFFLFSPRPFKSILSMTLCVLHTPFSLPPPPHPPHPPPQPPQPPHHLPPPSLPPTPLNPPPKKAPSIHPSIHPSIRTNQRERHENRAIGWVDRCRRGC